jgi:putative nucleotidyltransferase with HDIG domain
MVPNEQQIKALWDKYQLPPAKRIHVAKVAHVALYLARAIQKKDSSVRIDEALLFAAAMLHDIDKAIEKLPGEKHPDTGVRVLREEDMNEIANLVVTHPSHSILDEKISPKTWEERLLYLSDKMVKYEIITVDKRFDLWRAEELPAQAREILEACYPKVKELEREIFSLISMDPSQMARVV